MSIAKRAYEKKRAGQPYGDYLPWFRMVATWSPGPSEGGGPKSPVPVEKPKRKKKPRKGQQELFHGHPETDDGRQES